MLSVSLHSCEGKFRAQHKLHSGECNDQQQQITFSQRKFPSSLQNVANGEMKEAPAQRMGNVTLESLGPEILETYMQGGREGWEWPWAF